jgi:hypothetical protein
MCDNVAVISKFLHCLASAVDHNAPSSKFSFTEVPRARVPSRTEQSMPSLKGDDKRWATIDGYLHRSSGILTAVDVAAAEFNDLATPKLALARIGELVSLHIHKVCKTLRYQRAVCDTLYLADHVFIDCSRVNKKDGSLSIVMKAIPVLEFVGSYDSNLVLRRLRAWILVLQPWPSRKGLAKRPGVPINHCFSTISPKPLICNLVQTRSRSRPSRAQSHQPL